MAEGQKYCACCRKDKPLTTFDKNGFTDSGMQKLKTECKCCRSRAGKEARAEWLAPAESVEPTRSSARHKKREREDFCSAAVTPHEPLEELVRVAEKEIEEESVRSPNAEHFAGAMSRLLQGLSHLNGIKVLFVPAAHQYHRGELYDAAETVPLDVYRSVLGKEPLTREVEGEEPLAVMDTYEAIFVSLAFSFSWNVTCTKNWESFRRSSDLQKCNVVWFGNWLFEGLGNYKTKVPRNQDQRLLDTLAFMSSLETRGVVVFPPVSYVAALANKMGYLQCLAAFDRTGFEIPKIINVYENGLPPMSENGIVAKRNFSGRSDHVLFSPWKCVCCKDGCPVDDAKIPGGI